MLFLRQVVLFPLLRARHTRRLQASPTRCTAQRRTTLRPQVTIIRKALLNNTRRLLMFQKDYTHPVATVARARLLRHIRLWIRIRMAQHTP